MITQERLKEIVNYNPETGIFTRLVKTSKKSKIGEILGCLDEKSGYLSFTIDGKLYRSHRLAWLYMTGEWPKNDIDHENGIGSDNWWSNLRDADDSENQQNLKKAHSRNKSGFLGVSTQRYGFQATIYKNRKRIYLGLFKTPELAHSAYLNAKRKIHPFGTL